MNEQQDLTGETLASLRREIGISEKLQHEGIVKYIGAVLFPGAYTLVTEFCPYGSVATALQLGPFDNTTIVKILFDCCRVMSFMHSCNILHRDLKPENLLLVSFDVTASYMCKVGDLGEVKPVSSASPDTLTDKPHGTRHYVAPEYTVCKCTKKCDVYSFGIMMCVIANQGEFTLEYKSIIDLYEKVRKGARPSLLHPNCVPDGYKELMEICWDEDPTKRPNFCDIVGTLEDMLEKLKNEKK